MDFLAQITSYDYSAPISEDGGSGQPGIGGANKFEVPSKLFSPLRKWDVLHVPGM